MSSVKWRGGLMLLVAVLVAVVLVAMPSMVNSYRLYILTQVIIYGTACLGLTVLIGWSGQIALAHAGFFGVGAYASSYLYQEGVPWFVAVILAGAIAVLLGLVIGLPAVRLRGFYLAIATLAFGELLVRVFIEARGVTNGVEGLSVKSISVLGLDSRASLWYVSLGFFVVIAVALVLFGRGRIGRCLRAVRDAEVATASLGISAVYYKFLAFAMSAFIGAVAGSLFAQSITYITPEMFNLTLLIQFLVVVLVGGVTRVEGAIIGGAFVVLGRELLQESGEWQRLIFGVALILVIRFLPEGLASLPRRLNRESIRGSRKERRVADEHVPESVA
jgi:branched-chain amino acid transport system permease protein